MPEAGPDLPPLLSPQKAVERRNTFGGTSPEQVRRQIKDAGIRLADWRALAQARRDKLPGGY